MEPVGLGFSRVCWPPIPQAGAYPDFDGCVQNRPPVTTNTRHHGAMRAMGRRLRSYGVVFNGDRLTQLAAYGSSARVRPYDRKPFTPSTVTRRNLAWRSDRWRQPCSLMKLRKQAVDPGGGASAVRRTWRLAEPCGKGSPTSSTCNAPPRPMTSRWPRAERALGSGIFYRCNQVGCDGHQSATWLPQALLDREQWRSCNYGKQKEPNRRCRDIDPLHHAASDLPDAGVAIQAARQWVTSGLATRMV
jgi:hypothetical protein